MKQPFLIIGNGRSGSTYLSELLAPHPAIALTSEAKVLEYLAIVVSVAGLPAFRMHPKLEIQGIVGGDYSAAFSPIFKKHARQIILDFYQNQFPDKSFTHWGDKMLSPSSSLDLSELFPDLLYIMIVRDPRDVICSIKKYAHLPRIKIQHPQLAQYSLEEHCTHWNETYNRLFDFVKSHYLVKYESLIADPEFEARRALSYLGLAFSEENRRAIQANDSFSWNGTSPSPAASIGRWKKELSVPETKTVERLCGPLMEKFGYLDFD